MTMTRSGLVALVKRYRLESTARESPVMPDDQILAALRRAELRVVRWLDHEAFKKRAVVACPTGAVALPADCLCHARAAFLPAGDATRATRLRTTTAQAMDLNIPNWRASASGDPTYLVLESDEAAWTYRVWPAPAIAVTGGLALTYSKRPELMDEDTDESEVLLRLEEFEDTLLPFGALATLPMLEGGSEDDRAVFFDKLFRAEFNEFRAAVNCLLDPDAA